MSRDVSGSPWKFDTVEQGEGIGSRDSWLRTGTFVRSSGDIITYTGHGLRTGHGPVRVEEGNADLPSGLAEDTDYYIIWLSADTFSLATTAENAAAGTAVTLADAGTTPNYLLQKPYFPARIYVKTILLDAGAAGGAFEVHDKASGRSLTGALSLAANAHEQVVVKDFVEGVYMTSMADGQILVYHGKTYL